MHIIDVSVIIISWKMRDLLKACLDSIYEFSTGMNFEIILIDNNSLDGTSEMVKKEFPQIKLIINNENKGVAPARNQGINISSGKYILILDADVELIENSILKMYEYMERNKACGIVGCKLVNSYGYLQYSSKRFPTFLALFFRRLEHINAIRKSKTLRYHIMQEWDHEDIREVDYIIGACQFIRREVIEQIGIYDEKIFYGPEDIDYCLRAWKANWKVVYLPFTRIKHHEQRITKKRVFSVISLRHLKGIFYIYFKYKGSLKI